MSNTTVVAKFPFVVNKSFGGSSRPITIPARFYPILKENGITESVRVQINFRQELALEGSIRTGMRAGGRYYQLTMSKSAASESIAAELGSTLVVRLLIASGDWLAEIA